MSFDPILALISIIFGILVIAFKDLLNWIVGIFFILLGIWLLLDYLNKNQKKGTVSPPPTQTQASPAQPEQKGPPMEKK